MERNLLKSSFARKLISVVIALCLITALLPAGEVKAGGEIPALEKILSPGAASITCAITETDEDAVNRAKTMIGDRTRSLPYSDVYVVIYYDSSQSKYCILNYSGGTYRLNLDVTLEGINTNVTVQNHAVYVLGSYTAKTEIEGSLRIEGTAQVGRTLTAVYSEGNSADVGENVEFKWYCSESQDSSSWDEISEAIGRGFYT